MEIWPSTLPTYPEDGSYTETLPDTLLTSQTEIGPPKLRRRSTVSYTDVSAEYILQTDQLDDLIAFYFDSVNSGEEPFQWPHPRLEYNVVAAFKDIPVYTSTVYDLFKVSITLSILDDSGSSEFDVLYLDTDGLDYLVLDGDDPLVLG